MPKMTIKKTYKGKDLYYKRISDNQCTKCGGLPIEGRRLCGRCSEMTSDSNRATKDRLKKSGKCMDCGSYDREPGRLRCQSCLDKNSSKVKYHIAKSKGLCWVCYRGGLEVPVCVGEDGRVYVTCDEHRESRKVKGRIYNSYAKRQKEIYHAVRAKGLCWKCYCSGVERQARLSENGKAQTWCDEHRNMHIAKKGDRNVK